MRDNSKKIKLKDVGDIVTGKTPPTNDLDNYGNKYMFLGPTDLHKHYFIQKSEKMITEKGLNTIKGSILKGRSILIGCIGWDMGNIGIVDGTCATNQQINSITNIKKDYNPLYIYYWLKTKKDFLFQIANVTRTPLLNKTGFSNIEMDMPPRETQDKVASLLSSCDLKIELNNKINQELEEMAKTLYDYWFVQFDFPDENGKPYKSSGGKMVWSEELKREIPEGWEVKELSSIEPKIVTGKTPSTKNHTNFGGDIPFICIGDVRGNMHVTKTELTLTEKGANSQENKFIPEGSICVTCIATPGLVAFTTEDSQTNQQLNSIVPKNIENKYYLYFYLKDYFKFAKAKTGNTFANMNKGDFSSIKVINPRKELLALYHEKIDFSASNILNNLKENQKLTELRDWLLPMLMNGQVKVK